MDPASATNLAAEAYKVAGFSAVLCLILGIVVWAVWGYMRSQMGRLTTALEAEAAACKAREQSIAERLRQVENAGRDDLKEMLAASMGTAQRCADALHIASQAFERMASDSGNHRSIRDGR